MKEAGELVGGLLTIYGNEYLKTHLNQTSEPLIPSVINMKLIDTTSTPPPRTIPEYLALHKKHADIAEVYNNRWKEHQIDAIIMPPAPNTAVPHDAWGTWSYTVIWNLMDYRGFVIPVGEVESGHVVVMEREFYWEGDGGFMGFVSFPFFLFLRWMGLWDGWECRRC
ncbi:hypothetical protein HYFRA_00008775 [Hymenoscyphus fraxineus]|uniref:Amidase domain-containing protein n=1 Tax=Hymenoscyphus fraxineus TaxID=746836 RepID=A0A9N9L1M5_9HELO|nr:hypothetical protein HYFRA_00008775 [Hymenoscyphus fraxineus]